MIAKGNVHTAQSSKKSLQYCLQRLYDPGKLADISPTWQVPAVVHNDGDTAAAGAILDRFLHHAEVIRL
ncbi:hypothetical protein M1N93_00080 [Dehalococcoidia bacterium]|nr:hypothetical protein [Dehalococcoidia bacterium]